MYTLKDFQKHQRRHAHTHTHQQPAKDGHDTYTTYNGFYFYPRPSSHTSLVASSSDASVISERAHISSFHSLLQPDIDLLLLTLKEAHARKYPPPTSSQQIAARGMLMWAGGSGGPLVCCCPPRCCAPLRWALAARSGFWPRVPVPPCGVVRARAFSRLTNLSFDQQICK